MNPITIETFTEFRFVSNPSFSPNGKQIAFVAQQADLKDNAYHGDLYLYDVQEKTVRQATSSGDVKSYTWTKAGTLLFPSGREKKKTNEAGDRTVYYELLPDGGEAQKKFEVPLKASAIYAADEDRYLITAVSKLDSQEEDPAFEVLDEVPFWFNGKGFTNGLRTRLYLYRASEDSLTPVSEETAELGGFSVRGSRVLYKANPWADVRGRYDGIYLYDMDTGETRCLLGKDTMRTGMIGFWAEDEALVAASREALCENGSYLDFYAMNLSTGEMRLLAPYDYSSGSGSVGSDARLGGGRTVKCGDGICWFVTTRGSSACLYAIRRDGSLQAVCDREGSCDSFDVQDGHVVICGLYDGKLAELYLDGGQITQMNDMSRWKTSAPKEYHLKTADGQELTGWVLYPADYVPGVKYPAILNIHGGPRTVFGTVFHHEMQMWASAGYFVMYTNPRGSDGFGAEFGNINGRYGTIDYDDLMAFTDYVLEQIPDIDQNRLGVTGGSYGGFMTNWIIGHTDRFRAAASQRSIANWISFEYMSDIGHTFTKDNQAVFACEDVDKLWLHSPIRYIQNCKTPTLFVHSDADYRCNVAEGMQMFAALKVLGVDTRMCMVRGENHELSRSGKPRNRVLRMEEILRWMDRYLKEEEPDGTGGEKDRNDGKERA